MLVLLDQHARGSRRSDARPPGTGGDRRATPAKATRRSWPPSPSAMKVWKCPSLRSARRRASASPRSTSRRCDRRCRSRPSVAGPWQASLPRRLRPHGARPQATQSSARRSNRPRPHDDAARRGAARSEVAPVLERGQLAAHVGDALAARARRRRRLRPPRAGTATTSPHGSTIRLWPKVRRPFSCVPPCAGGDHVALVLDRARPQQHLPVRRAGRVGERRRHREQVARRLHQGAIELGKAQVVADAQADAHAGRRRTRPASRPARSVRPSS